MNVDEITKGIAAYSHEQQVLLRLLRRRSFTEREFDKWFKGREYRRPRPIRGGGITGDTLLLGIGVNGFSEWATYLDLMQHMMLTGQVDAKTINGVVTYSIQGE